MQTNNHQINDFSAVLAQKYGEVGSPERAKFDEEAFSFYSGQILLEARREVKVTQAQLAEKVGVNKSYISKIENGVIEPGVGLFLRIIEALGLRFSIVKPIM